MCLMVDKSKKVLRSSLSMSAECCLLRNTLTGRVHLLEAYRLARPADASKHKDRPANRYIISIERK